MSTLRKLIALLVCLCLAQLNFCQSDYPKLILIDGDSLVLITPSQVKKVNSLIVKADLCDKIDSLSKVEINLYKNRQEVMEMESELIRADLQINREIITEKNKQIESLEKENGYKHLQIKSLKLRNKIFTFGSLSVGVVAGFLISRVF